MSVRGDEGLFLRCLKKLDERVNVKALLRVWGPRCEFMVRLILVATFFDDSYRAATHFTDHVRQVGEEGYLRPLAASSPHVISTIATVALGIGLLAQSVGSLCLLALIRPDGAIIALIGWTIAQPVLYAQLANFELVAESLSLVGGLLILRAHLAEQAKHAPEATSMARTQFVGRLLLPTVYLYRAGLILRGNFADAQHRTDHSASMFVIDTAVFAGLVLGCAPVAAGLRSRAVALVLAIVNIGLVCYQHPFFRFAWREGGEWKYDEAKMRKSMPHVALPKEVSAGDFESWLIFDLHRYYFFQGLSTSGALLLLAQYGPGELAVEEDEVLLGDVQRARDYRQVPNSCESV